VQDIENRFEKYGFDAEKIKLLLEKFELKREDQLNRRRVEMLIESMFELELESKPKLRINNRDLLEEYVTDVEWRKLLTNYERLEKFCTLLEKRFDSINEFSNKEILGSQ
jgi:hypothetical protein